MNDQLQSQLASILKSLVDTVSAAKDFALDQLPGVVSEFLLYARISETLDVLFSLSAAAVLMVIALKSYRKGVTVDNGRGFGNSAEKFYLITLFASVFSVVCFITAIVNFNDMLMVWLAPKVYLIKHIAALVK